jgi:hypothetical protein
MRIGDLVRSGDHRDWYFSESIRIKEEMTNSNIGT